MARPRKMEHGHVDHGRLQLDRDVMEHIRIYLRVKVNEAAAALAAARAGVKRYRLPGSAEKVAYWEHVHAYLAGLYATGTRSVDVASWLTCATHVTTVERHTGDRSAPEQQVIPGME